MTMVITLLFVSATIFAQEVKKENETVKTKMDLFSSKTGTITKYVDTNLPNLKTAYGGAETKIRKIINVVNSAYFFRNRKQSLFFLSLYANNQFQVPELLINSYHTFRCIGQFRN